MANGVNTDNVDPVAISDEVLVNRDGSTGRQKTVDLATQLAGAGPLYEEMASRATKEELQSVKQIAQSAADIAVLNSQTYPDEATGRAAVADGAYFRVVGFGDVAFSEYRRTNPTTSVLVATYPSKDYIDSGKGFSGTAVVAQGAGYEVYNPFAVGNGITALWSMAGSVSIEMDKIGVPVSITKVADSRGSTWFGVHFRIPYETLSDLDKTFTLNLLTMAGVPPNNVNIIKSAGDWNPENAPVGFAVQALAEGGEGVNLYELIMATPAYTSVYQAQTHLYIVLAYFNPTASVVDAATANWSVRPQFLSGLDVVANKITAPLRMEIEEMSALGALGKAELLSVAAVRRTNASTAIIDQTYFAALGGESGIIGYDATLFNEGAGEYAYTHARLFYDYASEGADKKYRVYVRSDQRQTTVIVRFTNGASWGSSDGSVATAKSASITLNADNNYQGYADIDYTDYVAFYAQAGRAQAGFYILAYDGVATGPAITLSTYCLDISMPPALDDMARAFVSLLPDDLAEAQANIVDLRSDVTDLQNNAATAAYITCWGDSLTAGGGWTTALAALTGLPVYNGGTGGENAKTIVARQGGDVMIVNNITIPSTTSPVLIADRDVDGGIKTMLGSTVTPLLQGGAHVNPCQIGDVEGVLAWTGSNYADITGNWVFTRSVAGDAVQVTRPTAIRTNFDMHRNAGIQIIFIGQNGGYADNADLILQHRRMIEHARAKHTVVLGLSSGSAAGRAGYEAAMRVEFGRYFISLREYLAAPIYDVDGTTIISCYGLEDAGLTATQADIDAIATGTVPPQLLADSVHYTSACKTVIGNMLYQKLRDLNVI